MRLSCAKLRLSWDGLLKLIFWSWIKGCLPLWFLLIKLFFLWCHILISKVDISSARVNQLMLKCKLSWFTASSLSFRQSFQLCSLVPQASSQWGKGASDFQCKYPGGFLKRAWAAGDNWQLWVSHNLSMYSKSANALNWYVHWLHKLVQWKYILHWLNRPDALELAARQ